jgi:hypothetical protein
MTHKRKLLYRKKQVTPDTSRVTPDTSRVTPDTGFYAEYMTARHPNSPKTTNKEEV